MSFKFEIGQNVLVPARLLEVDEGSALVRREVLDRDKRQIKVQREVGENRWIATRKVHHDQIHVLVVRIGDIDGEVSLLDPLADSLTEHLRLLLNDGRVDRWTIRSYVEWEAFWTLQQARYSHVIVVSHGRPDGIKFIGSPSWISGQKLADDLETWHTAAGSTEFYFTGCQTGRAAFSKSLSAKKWCRCVVAPYQTVHGSVALLYLQQYFASILLDGLAAATARRKAGKTLPGGAHFVAWIDGAK